MRRSDLNRSGGKNRNPAITTMPSYDCGTALATLGLPGLRPTMEIPTPPSVILR